MNGFWGENWSLIDLISILSFIVGVQNLDLNERQIRGLDEHLKQQDDIHLAKIIQQNEELITLDKQIIELLRGKYEIDQRSD